jgi:MoaA/NifB/PqqE/SkfB family radical SAM enzyme
MKELIPHISPILLNKNITELTYFTTNKCNMQCKHCFVHNELNKKPKEPPISISEIIKMGEFIPHMQRVHLGGGEPFMRKDIGELAVTISNHWNTGVICIPTNGWYGDNIIKTIRAFGSNGKGQLRLHFSINSHRPQDMDDFTKVKGTFDRWRKNIALAIKESRPFNNITIVALSTFNEFNQNEFIDLIDFAIDDIGVDDFSFQLVRSHGDYNPDLNTKKFQQAIDYFFNKKNNQNVLLKNFRRAIREETIKYYDNPTYSRDCSSGRSRVVMSPEGNIYPCETKGYPNHESMNNNLIGSIRDFEYDICKLLSSNVSLQLQDEIKKNKCHCDHGIDTSLSMLTKPKTQFKILKETIIELVKL